MQLDSNSVLEGFAAITTVVGGVYAGISYLLSTSRIKKESYRKSIIDEANIEMAKIKFKLEEKIKALEIELDNQKENISKDIGHLKEVYNAEIKVLADKIDSLREDIQSQHTSMISLLTKLVNSH